MSFIFYPPKGIRIEKTKSSQEVSGKRKQFLNSSTEDVRQILCDFWKDQQNVITYQEMRQIILDGALSKKILCLWQQDYSELAASKFMNVWKMAMQAGSESLKILENCPVSFRLHTLGVMSWIDQRGTAFVTSCVDEQRNAIQTLLSKKMIETHTVDELAQMIRLCIGLTKGQARANARYYDSVVMQMKKDHPKMSTNRINRIAREAATKYAERQHRQRAAAIAQSELVYGYNQGADEGIRQAQDEKLLGLVRKNRYNESGRKFTIKNV